MSVNTDTVQCDRGCEGLSASGGVRTWVSRASQKCRLGLLSGVSQTERAPIRLTETSVPRAVKATHADSWWRSETACISAFPRAGAGAGSGGRAARGPAWIIWHLPCQPREKKLCAREVTPRSGEGRVAAAPRRACLGHFSNPELCPLRHESLRCFSVKAYVC